MKKLTFIEVNNSTNRAAIAKAEAKTDLSLPPTYREFLLDRNGGLSEECLFEIPGRGQSSLVFLGIDTGHEYTDAVATFFAYIERLPDSVFPIGVDPGGNLICIVCKGPETGAVYFWDHERMGSKSTMQDMNRLAHTFEDFVDNLQYENNEAW